eukprot:scaffold86650_cov59-Phaeocystis_antarctica.AAC.6
MIRKLHPTHGAVLGRADAPPACRGADATTPERRAKGYAASPAPRLQQSGGHPSDQLAGWARRLLGADVHGDDAGGARQG